MQKTLSALLFLLFSILASQNNAIAKDYGQQGMVYSIVERNLLEEIQAKLKEMQQNGKLAKFQDGVKKRMVDRVNKPKPVAGITSTKFAKSWLFDPTVFLDSDLADQNGRVFYKAGTKVNPLDHISLTRTLIFIDGDDEIQVKWALRQDKIKKEKTKIILVRGAIIDLMKQTGTRLYFDQNGTLTNKFSIKHVPATIDQEGKKLRITEVLI
jgi:conjugal transfer pilus assembly protein TraW